MSGKQKWVALGLLGLVLVVGARWLVRVADPDPSVYARPPGER